LKSIRIPRLAQRGVCFNLPYQALHLLLLLLERPGELVTRTKFVKRFGGDVYVDFEHGVNNAVNRLRVALGDSAKGRYIRDSSETGLSFRRSRRTYSTN